MCGVTQKPCQGSALISEEAQVAFRLGLAEHAFQGQERQGQLSVRLMGERLQHQDLVHASRAAPCLCRLKEPVQQSQGLANRAALRSARCSAISSLARVI